MHDGMDDDQHAGADATARRRRRRTPEAGQPAAPERPAVATSQGEVAPPSPEGSARPRPQAGPKRQRPQHDPGERGLRDIVGAGPSQVGVSGALRARDVNRPSLEDLAEAEAKLAIVRRNWQPPGDKPAGKK